MSKRKSSVDRKKDILDKTLDIIFNQGFHSLTMRKIAEKVGISEAAIYKHFNSKKEIIVTLVNNLFSENEFYKKIENQKDPYDALYKIMEKQFSYLDSRPEITSIIFEEDIFREYPEIKSKFKKITDKREDILTDFITSAQKKKQINQEIDPQSFALIYMGSIRISVLRWKNNDFSYSLKNQAKVIMGTLFQALK
ncbi:MAG: TetR/AcrR family transcriptional regulator [Halanaerobiales bacterium]